MLSVELHSIENSPTPLDLTVQMALDAGIVGIMGPSGCGKTTLLRVLAGLETRYNGQLLIDNRTLWSSDNKTSLKTHQRNIGLVFQDARLFPHLDVKGNLLFAQKRSNHSRFNLAEVVQWLGIQSLLPMSVANLSGGQKQRVAVARALLHGPDLLLLDEPFVALDMAARIGLLDCLKQINQQSGLPMLYVTHDIHDIRRLCRQLLLMSQGTIIQSGETFPLLNQLETSLTLATPIAATVRCQRQEVNTETPLIQLKLGRQTLLVSGSNQGNYGKTVNCVIAAGEVSISLTPVHHCSIANCLSVEIARIVPLDSQNVMLELSCESQKLYAQITEYSASRLELEIGDQVFALFKASAVSLLSI